MSACVFWALAALAPRLPDAFIRSTLRDVCVRVCVVSTTDWLQMLRERELLLV